MSVDERGGCLGEPHILVQAHAAGELTTAFRVARMTASIIRNRLEAEVDGLGLDAARLARHPYYNGLNASRVDNDRKHALGELAAVNEHIGDMDEVMSERVATARTYDEEEAHQQQVAQDDLC